MGNLLPALAGALIWLGLTTARTVVMVLSTWTPAVLPSLVGWYPTDKGRTHNRQGPSWASQPGQTHARGLAYNGTDNYVDVVTPIYDDTAVAVSYTVLAFIDSSLGSLVLYGEGAVASSTPNLQLKTTTTAGRLQVLVRDDAGVNTVISTVSGVATDGDWNVITLVLDAAGTGWRLHVNGADHGPIAYANAPDTTTLDTATLGAFFRTTPTSPFDGPMAYAMRHTSALSLAQVRQVQQYIADAVADDISLTVAGSETANANSPQDAWPFDEDADGKELANSGSASTVGQRKPGDSISNVDDRSANDDDAAQATEVEQPRFLADGFAAGKPGIGYDGVDDDMVATFTGGALTQPFVVAIPYRCDTWTSGDFLFDGDDGTNSVAVYESGGNVVIDAGGTARTIESSGNMEGTHVLVCVLDGANSKVYLDGGASRISASPGTNVIDGLTFAADHAGANNLDCVIGDCVVNDGALSDAAINNLGRYVADKLGTSWTAIS